MKREIRELCAKLLQKHKKIRKCLISVTWDDGHDVNLYEVELKQRE